MGNSKLLESIGNLTNLENLYFDCETTNREQKFSKDCLNNLGNLKNLHISLYNIG